MRGGYHFWRLRGGRQSAVVLCCPSRLCVSEADCSQSGCRAVVSDSGSTWRPPPGLPLRRPSSRPCVRGRWCRRCGAAPASVRGTAGGRDPGCPLLLRKRDTSPPGISGCCTGRSSVTGGGRCGADIARIWTSVPRGAGGCRRPPVCSHGVPAGETITH